MGRKLAVPYQENVQFALEYTRSRILTGQPGPRGLPARGHGRYNLAGWKVSWTTSWDWVSFSFLFIRFLFLFFRYPLFLFPLFSVSF